jgi:hypothetical protein
MNGLKLGVTNQMPRRIQGGRFLWTPDFQQIEESFLSKVTTATLTSPFFEFYTIHKHCQNDEGHANHLHLPPRFLRTLRSKIGCVRMTDAMPYSFTWPSSLA